MKITVIKGVDDEIEFKGFRGRYFYMLAIGTVSLLMLVFFLYMIGFTSFWLLLFAFCMALVMYVVIKAQMDKFGKYGHIHQKHKGLVPRNILNDKSPIK